MSVGGHTALFKTNARRHTRDGFPEDEGYGLDLEVELVVLVVVVAGVEDVGVSVGAPLWQIHCDQSSTADVGQSTCSYSTTGLSVCE